MKSALICGVAGQDGSYLAKFLLEKGYQVIGTSRDSTISNFVNLEKLGIRKDVEKTSMAINDLRSVKNILQRYQPDEIYNLAGQTSVALSFEQPIEAMESIAGGTLNILESLKYIDHPIRFYNAGSSECFGETSSEGATEQTPFNPRSPYAAAKAASHWLLRNYRESYGIFVCTGILFNHESPLRPESFVTQKIIRSASKISDRKLDLLELGNINIYRDWGWSPDYVQAMWLMLQKDAPDDYVIATGEMNSLEYFIEKAFDFFGLDWRNHVTFKNQLRRPSDIMKSCGNPTKAFTGLGWRASMKLDGVIRSMCEATLSENE
jgi:GDPmannose 4,6-dehydratase